MKIGILVNTSQHLQHIVGISQAASEKGHEILIFAMDEGTQLLEDARFTDLSGLVGVTMSLCRHSAEERAIDIDAVPKDVTRGSQFNNALMSHEADRIIVL